MNTDNQNQKSFIDIGNNNSTVSVFDTDECYV
mgnify:CR=1 FL=1